MARRLLPTRRSSVTISFLHAFPGTDPQPWDFSFGLYEDGSPGEVFIDAFRSKQTSQMGIAVRESAILASIALQHGASVDELRAALLRDEPVRGNEADLPNPHGVLAHALDILADELAELTPPATEAALRAEHA